MGCFKVKQERYLAPIKHDRLLFRSSFKSRNMEKLASTWVLSTGCPMSHRVALTLKSIYQASLIATMAVSCSLNEGVPYELSVQQSPLINAEASSGVGLSEAQASTFGRFYVNDQFYCSAVAVSDRHVLTAEHCVSRFELDEGGTPLDVIDFRWRTLEGDEGSRSVARVVSHHSADVAVLTLEAEGDLAWDHLAIVNEGAPPPVGETLEVAGFGSREAPSDESQRALGFSRYRVTRHTFRTLELERVGEGVLCRGDSGGPLYTSEMTLVALDSQGATDCMGPDHAVRLDQVRAWLDAELARPYPEEEQEQEPSDMGGALDVGLDQGLTTDQNVARDQALMWREDAEGLADVSVTLDESLADASVWARDAEPERDQGERDQGGGSSGVIPSETADHPRQAHSGCALTPSSAPPHFIILILISLTQLMIRQLFTDMGLKRLL